MSNENVTFNANINQKEQPPGLYVHGSVMVYTAETTVDISKAEPQGVNPTILLLDLIVEHKDGPMKGVPRAFHFEERGDGVLTYKQVALRYGDGETSTVDIEVFG